MTEAKNYTIKVNEKCQGCGICYSKYPNYFLESEDGTAYTKERIHSLSTESIEKISKECPCEAIVIEEKCGSNRQLYFEFLEKLKNYNVKQPTKEEFKFIKDNYSIPIPYASGEYKSEYSSDSVANKAAQREFENKMYSQINALILKVITEYRVDVLKPYYSKDEGSIFTKSNQELSELIKKLIHFLRVQGIANDIPNDIWKIALYPDSDITWKMLNNGELMADNMISIVRSEFDSGSYSSASSYEMYWKTDYRSVIAGKDWRGNLKFKDKYHYYNLSEAFRELAKDIWSAFEYKASEIENRALEHATRLVSVYNKMLKEELASKISYFENKIDEFEKDELSESNNIFERVELSESKNIFERIFGVTKDSLNGRVFITAIKRESFYGLDAPIGSFGYGTDHDHKYIEIARKCDNATTLDELQDGYEEFITLALKDARDIFSVFDTIKLNEYQNKKLGFDVEKWLLEDGEPVKQKPVVGKKQELSNFERIFGVPIMSSIGNTIKDAIKQEYYQFTTPSIGNVSFRVGSESEIQYIIYRCNNAKTIDELYDTYEEYITIGLETTGNLFEIIGSIKTNEATNNRLSFNIEKWLLDNSTNKSSIKEKKITEPQNKFEAIFDVVKDSKAGKIIISAIKTPAYLSGGLCNVSFYEDHKEELHNIVQRCNNSKTLDELCDVYTDYIKIGMSENADLISIFGAIKCNRGTNHRLGFDIEKWLLE